MQKGKKLNRGKRIFFIKTLQRKPSRYCSRKGLKSYSTERQTRNFALSHTRCFAKIISYFEGADPRGGLYFYPWQILQTNYLHISSVITSPQIIRQRKFKICCCSQWSIPRSRDSRKQFYPQCAIEENLKLEFRWGAGVKSSIFVSGKMFSNRPFLGTADKT